MIVGKEMNKSPFIVTLIALCLVLGVIASAQQGRWITKQKKIHRHFKVTAGDTLVLFNQSGNIVVNTWNKNDLTVEIAETGTAMDPKRAQTILDNISTTEDTTNKRRLSFRTSVKALYNSDSKIHTIANPEYNNTNVQVKYEADATYIVYAPKSINLIIVDGAGTTTIDDLSGNLDLSVAHGCFRIKNLYGENNRILAAPCHGDCHLASIKNGSLVSTNWDGKLYIGTQIDTNKVKITGWDSVIVQKMGTGKLH